MDPSGGQEVGMTDTHEVSRLSENGHYCRRLEESEKLQQVWKSYYRDLFNIGKEDVFSAFRITASKLGLCKEGEISQVLNQSGKMNHVDVETGKLFVSPTSKNRVQLVETARRSAERASPVRVSVISSSDAGTVGGWDLGSYVVSLVDSHNFIVLVPNPHGNEEESLLLCAQGGEGVCMGRKLIFDGMCFESEGEARFAVLLKELGVPYHYERKEHMVPLKGGGQNYLIDFLLWPGERRSCYVEKKHHKPTLTEEEKVRSLVRRTGRTTYIVWGADFCQSIRTSTSDPEATGLKAVRFRRRGRRVLRQEGFYLLSAREMATGEAWKQVMDQGEDGESSCGGTRRGKEQRDVHPVTTSLLPSLSQEESLISLLSSKKRRGENTIRLSKRERKRIIPLPICKRTLLRLKDGTVYQPRDTLSLSFTSDPRNADCHSHDILNALCAAKSYVFG